MQDFATIYRANFAHLNSTVVHIWDEIHGRLAAQSIVREKFDLGGPDARAVLRVRSKSMKFEDASLYITNYEMISLDNDGNYEPPFQPVSASENETVPGHSWMQAMAHYGVSIIQNEETEIFYVERQHIVNVMPNSVGFLGGVRTTQLCEALAALHTRELVLADEATPGENRVLYIEDPLLRAKPTLQ